MMRMAWSFVALLGLSACDQQELCDGRKQSSGVTAPVIDKFAFVRQETNDPWLLIFALDFSDNDGDLSQGTADVFLAGDAPHAINMHDLFNKSEVLPEAQSGTLGLDLRFSDSISDGTKGDLQVQISDGASQRSNCYEITLGFSVEKVEPQ
jgi:hypothetical protein